MSDAGSLTIAFMRAHPVEAAQVLGSAEPAVIADLVAVVPVRVAGPVLAELQPNLAASVLVALPVDRAAALLERVGQQPSVVLLRHVSDPLRSELIAALPTAAGLATKLLLGYPDDSVGACVNPDVVAVTAATAVIDVVERVRILDAPVDEIFVVDDERRLLGWVRLDTALRATGTSPIGALVMAATEVLPASMPLAGAVGHPGWLGASALPVIERGDRLLGVLTHDSLVRALERARRLAYEDHSTETLAVVLIASYWQSLVGIMESLTAVLPQINPVAGQNREQ